MKGQIHNKFNKGKSKDSNEIERQEMLALFHQAEKEFDVKEKLMEDLSEEQETVTVLPDFKILFSRLWGKIEQKQKHGKTKLRYLNNFIKIAAAVMVGMLGGIYVTSLKNTPSEPVYYAAHAPKGSISEMILPDSSVIFLNAGSHIKYSIDGYKGKREVFLEGEAWFDVAKNKEKPFVVHTPYYDVNVTGTLFNIKAYDDDNLLTTTLEEGQVVIQSTEKFRLAEEIVLKPGEQVVLNKESRNLAVKKVNTKWFTSWKDNKLIFVNMNLKDLVVLLERKYGVDIEVESKDILDLHFDGTIKDETIIEFLEIVQKTLPVNYEIVGQHIQITNNKN